jgi:ABC-type dipeptide/oligopeptide/nickel transport system permease subunit
VHRIAHLGKLLAELGRYAARNKAWWLVPMVVVLLVLGFLIATGQATAPFIYTLF